MTRLVLLCTTLLVINLLVPELIGGYVLDNGHRGKKGRAQSHAPVKTNEEERRGDLPQEVTAKYGTTPRPRRNVSSPSSPDIFDRFWPSRFHGHVQLGPHLTFNVSTGLNLNNDYDERWWNGPNVCKTEEEKVEEEERSGEKGGWTILHHRLLIAHSCDNTDSAYTCTTTRSANGKTTTVTRTHECCPGFSRQNEHSLCTADVELVDLVSTLEHLSATEMVRALDLSGLTNLIQQSNYSVFAPTNEAFDKYRVKVTDANVVIVSPEMSRGHDAAITSHVVPGFVKMAAMEDEQLIDTEQSGAQIRINKYNIRSKKSQILTANCMPLLRTDVKATNGIVHVVDGVLEPVNFDLKELVKRQPKLRIISKVLEGMELKDDGHYTLLAPTDEAFSKLSPGIREKILNGHSCGLNVIKQHLLPNVICSPVIQGRVRTPNSLNQWIRMSRGKQGELLVETAEVLQQDLMATNGVLYVIDEVILPSGAEDVLEVAEKAGATKFLGWLKSTGLDTKLQNMDNFTLLLPSNDAIVEYSKMSADGAKINQDEMQQMVLNHIVPRTLRNADLYDDLMLTTASGRGTLRVKEYETFPFSRQASRKTIQCSAIVMADMQACGGMVHVVNKLITPPSGDVFDLLQKNEQFGRLLSLVRSAGLMDLLKRERPLTFFAPTNEAFGKLSKEFVDKLNDSVTAKKVLLSHMLPDTLCCSGVFSSQLFMSHATNLDGWLIGVEKTDGAMPVNFGSAHVKSCDLAATNGVVHAMDSFAPSVVARYGDNGGRRRGGGGHGSRFQWEDFWSLFD